MPNHERIISRPAAEQIVQHIHTLAERRITAMLTERVRALYRQGQAGIFFSQTGHERLSEEEFVQRLVSDEAYRELFRPSYGDKYTFISPHGNVQFLYNDFTYEDIPPDVELILAEASGSTGEYLAFNAKVPLGFQEFKDPSANRVLIQGPDRTWVNDTYEQLNRIIDSSQEPLRDIAYRWTPAFVWLTFFAALAIEYRLANLMAGISWNLPLNGLQLLFVFVILALTLISASNIYQRLLRYLFPYIELENNISRKRKVWRKPVVAAVGVLYAAAVGFLFAFK
jgi:hypothetical protein